MAEQATHGSHQHDDVGHHVPLWLLAAVLLVLLVLTFITVGSVWWIDLGHTGNLLMAMIIATIKGTLVALYFMHLRYDKPIIAIILIAALFFVALFTIVALIDTGQYQPDITDYRAVDPDARSAPLLQLQQ